jgi:hypothetical protein
LSHNFSNTHTKEKAAKTPFLLSKKEANTNNNSLNTTPLHPSKAMAPTTNDTSLADRTTLNIQNRLLGLAAELRNAIYDLVLSPPDIANVFQATDTDAVYIFQTTEIVKKPALLLVSEQTRAETTSLWYGSRPSRVEVTAHTVSWFGEWAANLKDGDLVLIKHLTVIFWLEEKHLYDDEGFVLASQIRVPCHCAKLLTQVVVLLTL